MSTVLTLTLTVINYCTLAVYMYVCTTYYMLSMMYCVYCTLTGNLFTCTPVSLMFSHIMR